MKPTNNTLPARILSEIVYYISNHENITIASLSNSLQIDLLNVRKLIHFLCLNFNSEFVLCFDNIDSEEILDFEYNDSIDLKEGKLDNSVLSLNGNYLCLKKSDYNHYINSSKTDLAPIIFKDAYQTKEPSSANNVSLLNTLADLIKSNEGSIIEAYGKKYYPISIIYNAYKRSFYILSITSEKNLIFIPSIDAKYLQTAPYPRYISKELIKRAKHLREYIWNQEEISLSSEIEEVKFRIDDAFPKKKIVHELSSYKTSISVNPDGATEVTIEIVVTPSFITWLKSYGSSVVVLNNQRIIDEIVNSYKEVYILNK